MRLSIVLAVVLASTSARATEVPAKGSSLYVSAVGLTHFIPTGFITYVPLANMDCPPTIAGCTYRLRPCERVRVKSVKSDGTLIVDAASWPSPHAIEGDWSLVLTPDLMTCLKTITHVQVKIVSEDPELNGQTYFADPVDCSELHLSEPCESDRPRPLIEDRGYTAAWKYPGWKVLGTAHLAAAP